jgi:hypothetical protein
MAAAALHVKKPRTHLGENRRRRPRPKRVSTATNCMWCEEKRRDGPFICNERWHPWTTTLWYGLRFGQFGWDEGMSETVLFRYHGAGKSEP